MNPEDPRKQNKPLEKVTPIGDASRFILSRLEREVAELEEERRQGFAIPEQELQRKKQRIETLRSQADPRLPEEHLAEGEKFESMSKEEKIKILEKAILDISIKILKTATEVESAKKELAGIKRGQAFSREDPDSVGFNPSDSDELSMRFGLKEQAAKHKLDQAEREMADLLAEKDSYKKHLEIIKDS